MNQFLESGMQSEDVPRGWPRMTAYYDLLKALQAADVARGASYDEAAARFPQLFRYQKEEPFNVKLFSGTPQEQVDNVINPILKREGYPLVSLKKPLIPQLNGLRKRHRTFFRAIDIDGPGETYQDQFNRKQLAQQAKEHFGSDADLFKKIAAGTLTSKEPTGGFKAFAIDVIRRGM